MKLVETTIYDLKENYVAPRFVLEIKKEETKTEFLIYLGMKMAYNKISLNVEEIKNTIILKINEGRSIKGNFTSDVELIKQKIVRMITELATEYSINMEIELIKTKTMEDVFEAKKEYALKKENPEEYCIFGNPECFLKKNTDLTSLSIKIGKLFYSDEQYKDGFLGKILKEFSEKHVLNCKDKERRYFDVTNEELLDLIDLLEPK